MTASSEVHRTRDRRTDGLVYHRAGWRCQMPECLCPDGREIDQVLRTTTQPWAPSIDHVIPLAEGGVDRLENKRAAHRKCNEAAAIIVWERTQPGVPLATAIGDLYPDLAKLFTL
jgi:HNH endonuclease